MIRAILERAFNFAMDAKDAWQAYRSGQPSPRSSEPAEGSYRPFERPVAEPAREARPVVTPAQENRPAPTPAPAKKAPTAKKPAQTGASGKKLGAATTAEASKKAAEAPKNAPAPGATAKASKPVSPPAAARKRSESGQTREALYQEATKLDVRGRKDMTKAELTAGIEARKRELAGKSPSGGNP